MSDNDDIMIIADDGTAIRVKSTEISIIGRNTKGVRIMKLKEGSKIVCVAVAPNEDDENLDKTLDEKIAQDEKEMEQEVESEIAKREHDTQKPLEDDLL